MVQERWVASLEEKEGQQSQVGEILAFPALPGSAVSTSFRDSQQLAVGKGPPLTELCILSLFLHLVGLGRGLGSSKHHSSTHTPMLWG